eukprot:TRINITY_DN80114_c0_g1_i1.p1 TRINITY_DN80114_c0_g1~~TRINITY_DN80114_c0_g1_i1.p1  ORF type:complete len:632 (+),score=111.20 TRINITY_DN80114_c0_g1_i1:69-1964(+)
MKIGAAALAALAYFTAAVIDASKARVPKDIEGLASLASQDSETDASATVHIKEASHLVATLGLHPDSDAHQEIAAELSTPEMSTLSLALTNLLKLGAEQSNASQDQLAEVRNILNATMVEALEKADNESRTALAVARSNFTSSCLANICKDYDTEIVAAAQELQITGVNRCADFAQYCNHTQYGNIAKGLCKITCDTCPQQVSLLEEASDPVNSVSVYFDAYEKCKALEAAIEQNLSYCEYSCSETLKVVGQNCTSDPGSCSDIDCSSYEGESYEGYLLRIISHLENLKANMWSHNGTHRCRDIKERTQECYRNCEGITDPFVPNGSNVPPCCAPRSKAENLQCQALQTQLQDYTPYSTCYDSTLSNWNSVAATAELHGKYRSSQMRIILRLLCLVDSFGPQQKTKLTECIAKNFTQDPQVLKFLIDAGEPPSKLEFTCVRSEVPGTAEYDAIHYSHLPGGTEACPAVHCTSACGYNNSGSTFYQHDLVAQVNNSYSKGTCFKPLSTSTAAGVYWDFGTASNPGTISLQPGFHIVGIDVYTTITAPGGTLLATEKCGRITHAARNTDCHGHPAARYLALVPVTGEGHECIHGDCGTSWCEMMVDGNTFVLNPMASTGTSYQGAIITSSTPV